jgi:hypothetical protein
MVHRPGAPGRGNIRQAETDRDAAAFISRASGPMKLAEANMEVKVNVSGRELARNTGLNIIGRIVPLLVALAAMPYVVRRLGPDRFGLSRRTRGSELCSQRGEPIG